MLNKNFNLNNEPIIQKNGNEKKDKSPLRNWLNKERNNLDIINKPNNPFDFITNKEVNDMQNNMKNNIRTNNSVNMQKTSQINLESLYFQDILQHNIYKPYREFHQDLLKYFRKQI